jgi:iron complex outermembrane receptor protein
LRRERRRDRIQPSGRDVGLQLAPDSARAAAARDTVVMLPEVRVEGARPVRGAREKQPTGFTSDLSMGMTGHALETIAEVLSQAPGVRVLQYGGLGAFSTVSLRGAPAGQVSVFLDGAPLTSASHGVVNLADLPVSAVERIEVYRDLSPLPLGAATPGGAIQLVTLAARERLDARVTRGSFDTWDGRMSAGFARGPARGALHLGYQGSNGDFRYHDDNGTPLNPGDDEISTRVNNRLDAASALATVSVGSARTATVTARQMLFRKAQGVPGLGAIPAYNASLDYLRSLTQLEVARTPRGMVPGVRLSGALERERTQSQDLLGRLGLGRHDTDDHFGSDLVNAALDWSRFRALSIEGSGSLRVESATAPRRGGWAPRSARERAHRPRRCPRPPAAPAARSRRAPRGAALGAHRGSPALGLIAGAPAAHRRGARDAIAAARRARRHRGRARAQGELVARRAAARFHGAVRQPGERAGELRASARARRELDAGARWARSTARGWNGAAEWSHFESDTRDLILYKKYSQSSVQALNVSRGVIRGEEFSLSAGTPWGLAASAAATLQEARDRGPVRAYYGKRLPQRPERQLTGRVEYRRRRLGLGADLDFLGDDFLDQYNAQRVASRTLVGAWLSLAVLGEGMRFTLEGKNLGNRGVADVGGYPLPGRSLFISCETRIIQH